MSTSLSPRSDAVVLPSLPPSPSLLDEVFSHPRPWSVRLEDFGSQGSRRFSPRSASSYTKGKRKQTSEDDDEEEDEDEDAPHRVGTHKAYPPTTDGAAETRQVEETLKRWDIAERQRRKAARESVHHTSSPSLLSSVTRTASLVLSRRSGSIATTVGVGPGGTHTFKSHEAVDVAREGYAVPLDDIDRTSSSGDVAVYSPSPSLFNSRNTSLDTGPSSTSPAPGSSENQNPFVHPSERPRAHTPTTPTPMLPSSGPASPSPFADSQTLQGMQADPSTYLSAESRTRTSTRWSGGKGPSAPSPRPLDLPSPPEDVLHAKPLQPTPQPVLRPLRREEPEETQEVRWWHDWLCGCSEGGDNQAGRTNPFE